MNIKTAVDLSGINWTQDGLLPVIAQDYQSDQVLMMAWMDKEALMRTIELGKAVYWSRSRQRLWQKGEQSGHYQIIKDIRLDCDRDTLLIKVEQKGNIACHTGRAHCFYRALKDGRWQKVENIVKNPEEIYEK